MTNEYCSMLQPDVRIKEIQSIPFHHWRVCRSYGTYYFRYFYSRGLRPLLKHIVPPGLIELP